MEELHSGLWRKVCSWEPKPGAGARTKTKQASWVHPSECRPREGVESHLLSAHIQGFLGGLTFNTEVEVTMRRAPRGFLSLGEL